MVIRLVEDIRRYQPRIGGKKLYKLLKTDLDKWKGHMGRDKFFDILRKRKIAGEKKKEVCNYNRFLSSVS